MINEETKNSVRSIIEQILEQGKELIQKTFEDPKEAEKFGKFVIYIIINFIQRTAEEDREPLEVKAEANTLMMYLRGLAESKKRLTIEKVEE